jgi:hypothetical protein
MSSAHDQLDLFRDVWPDAGRAYRDTFAREAGGIPPRDPKVTAAEAPRLGRQCRAIVDRLRRGRATNAELAGMALKFTGRISDCRAAGYDIRVVSRDYTTGVVWYALFVGGEEAREAA